MLAKCERQRVVKLLTCNFYCLKNRLADTKSVAIFLVIKGLLWNLGSRSQQLRPLKFEQPDTACIRASNNMFARTSQPVPARYFFCSPASYWTMCNFRWFDITFSLIEILPNNFPVWITQPFSCFTRVYNLFRWMLQTFYLLIWPFCAIYWKQSDWISPKTWVFPCALIYWHWQTWTSPQHSV